MKFGKLILRKIIKIFATRYLIFGIKCTKKSIWAGAPPQTPLGELTAAPKKFGKLILRKSLKLLPPDA